MQTINHQAIKETTRNLELGGLVVTSRHVYRTKGDQTPRYEIKDDGELTVLA